MEYSLIYGLDKLGHAGFVEVHQAGVFVIILALLGVHFAPTVE